MSNLSFEPVLYCLDSQGIWVPKSGVMVIGGTRSKGLGGFHLRTIEASKILEEGGQIKLSRENREDVQRYQDLKQILAENRWSS